MIFCQGSRELWGAFSISFVSFDKLKTNEERTEIVFTTEPAEASEQTEEERI